MMKRQMKRRMLNFQAGRIEAVLRHLVLARLCRRHKLGLPKPQVNGGAK
jgi:hypothetical protein